MKPKTTAQLALLDDDAFESYMKRRSITGMGAFTLSKKRRDYISQHGRYLTGECPACSEPIPPLALPGEACPACGHTFTA